MRKLLKRWPRWALLALCAAILALSIHLIRTGGRNVSEATFHEIRAGMTLSEVESILGGPTQFPGPGMRLLPPPAPAHVKQVWHNFTETTYIEITFLMEFGREDKVVAAEFGHSNPPSLFHILRKIFFME